MQSCNRAVISVFVFLSACATEAPDITATGQALVGPSGVTASPRAASQIAVSWTMDPTAVQYQVFQSTGAGALVFAASVFGTPPATSYVADGLTPGAMYCFAIKSLYSGGSLSDLSAAVCGVAVTTGAAAAAGVAHTVQYPIDLGSATTWQDGQTGGGGGAKLTANLGDQIVAVRARVQDTTTTKLAVALQRVAEGAVSTVATSPQSLGNGTKQTLAISGLTETVISGQTYQVLIQKPVGFDNSFSWWIEVDYQ